MLFIFKDYKNAKIIEVSVKKQIKIFCEKYKTCIKLKNIPFAFIIFHPTHQLYPYYASSLFVLTKKIIGFH